MQLILVQIKWHIKWKYLIQKFHDICLSYYFNNSSHHNFERDPSLPDLDLFGQVVSDAQIKMWKLTCP